MIMWYRHAFGGSWYLTPHILFNSSWARLFPWAVRRGDAAIDGWDLENPSWVIFSELRKNPSRFGLWRHNLHFVTSSLRYHKGFFSNLYVFELFGYFLTRFQAQVPIRSAQRFDGSTQRLDVLIDTELTLYDVIIGPKLTQNKIR